MTDRTTDVSRSVTNKFRATMSRRNRSSGSSEAQFFRSLGSGVFELTPGSRSTRQRTGLLVEAEQLQDAAVPEDAEGVGDIVMHSAQEAELLAENERNPFSVPQVRAQEEVVIIEAEDEAPSSDGGDSKHWVTFSRLCHSSETCFPIARRRPMPIRAWLHVCGNVRCPTSCSLALANTVSIWCIRSIGQSTQILSTTSRRIRR